VNFEPSVVLPPAIPFVESPVIAAPPAPIVTVSVEPRSLILRTTHE
jgi:hypothetical protein